MSGKFSNLFNYNDSLNHWYPKNVMISSI